MPVDIEVTPSPATGPQGLDEVLIAPGGTAEAALIAVPVRRSPLRAFRDPGPGDDDPGSGDTEGGGPPPGDGWAEVTGTGTSALATAIGLSVPEAVTAFDLSGKPGETVRVAARTADGVRRLILLGVGDGSPADLRRAGAALARQVGAGTTALAALPAGTGPDPFVEGVLLGGYQYSLRSRDREDSTEVEKTRTVRLLRPASGWDEAAARASGAGPATARPSRSPVVAAAVSLARDLVNTPSGVKTPAWLARQAAAAAARSGLQVRIRDEGDLAAEGFGGILAVGAGSAHPPRMIELSYAPASAPGGARDHVVLAGKGITFDSGGLSLKPNEAMKQMKTDMAGAAAVIGVLSALAALDAPIRVTGLVAAAENLPSGSAMRPGDVITSYGGRTIEVLNTDAEGRLVLADLLGYAATLDAGTTVDLATLTGAVRIALGGQIGALYSSDDDLAAALRAAGQATGERLWRMPLPEDYTSALTSVTADLAHVPSRVNGATNGQAGSIVAALFLREFTGGRRWAHLDIAGAARSASDDGELTKGGTGFGTRLLLHWLAPAAS
ncbi:MAG TPA: leucyl aminopeptidase family protein [Streptosporangiaceae bacterium]